MKTQFIFYLFILIWPLSGNAQFVMLKGNILDNQSGIGVKDVNIFDSKTGIGTISNAVGFFSLMLRQGDVSLVVTHDSFKDYTQTLVLKTDTMLNIKLEPVLNLKQHQKSIIGEAQAINSVKKK